MLTIDFPFPKYLPHFIWGLFLGLIVAVLVFPVNFGSPQFPVFATTSTKIEKEIEDKKGEKESIEKQLSDLESRIKELQGNIARFENQLSVTEQELAATSAEVTKLENKIASLEEQISALEKDREAKETLRNKLVRRLYKEQRLPFWEVLLEGRTSARLSKAVVYQSRTISELKKRIAKVNEDIASAKEDRERLTTSKSNLSREVARLTALKNSLAREKQDVEIEAVNIQSEKEELSIKLAKVSAEIRKLMQAKLSATSERMTVGNSEIGDQDLPDPDFSPAFAIVSHGYPHRVGLSQYGAKGRAEAGQDYKEILSAYYDIDEGDIEDYSPVEKIHVKGCSAGKRSCAWDDTGCWERWREDCLSKGYKWYDDVIDFEDYLKSLGEMPSSWPEEALKAQAVAARTYALYYIDSNEKGMICPSPRCQAYLGYEKGGAWNVVVEDTEGEAIIKGGKPIAAYYCSTAGGFTRLTSDWEPTDVFSSGVPYDKRVIDNPSGSLGGWENSYGKDSPWMSWAHYKEGVEDPWLTEEELVDIVNVALIYENIDFYEDQEDDELQGKLYQESPVAFDDDIEPGISAAEVREILGDDAVEEIDGNSIKVEWSSAGYTSKVRFGDDVEIGGEDFAQAFNMRSPGYTMIYSSLYSFKVEK